MALANGIEGDARRRGPRITRHGHLMNWQGMFENFEAALTLSPAGQRPGEPWEDPFLMSARGYPELAGRYAGCTFGDGLYRLHDASSGPTAAEAVTGAFPEFAARATPFAFDWLGRQFALDRARVDGEPQVLMLEPGTGEALEIPCGFVGFHDDELVNFGEAALAESFFAAWRESNPAPIAFSDCVGYRLPLFLGGEDELSNLELVDWDVYWTITGQLRRGAGGPAT